MVVAKLETPFAKLVAHELFPFTDATRHYQSASNCCMGDDKDDERILIERVLAGHRGAFEALVHRYQSLVWAMVYRMLQHPDDTLDLCQEVFLKVRQYLPRFRAESSLLTWIGRIAYTTAARELKRKRVPLVHVDDYEDEAFVEQLDGGFDLQSALADQELIGHMADALERLAPLPRTVMTLHYLQELSVVEISNMLDMPEGTVKSHLYRGRKILAAHLTRITGE